MSLPRVPALEDFVPESVRGTPGFFRLGKTRAGMWWFIDPYDRAFFAKAVGRVRPLADEAPTEAWLHSAVHRLRGWHFNTLGAGSRTDLEGSGLYEVLLVGFKRVGPSLCFGAMHLPDVFDPAWIRAIDARAREICFSSIARRDLIGYYTDDGLEWAQPDGVGGRRPGLLQLCLSLEPSHRAYHAAWEFALASHRGDLVEVGKAWGLNLNHRDVVRQLTQQEAALDSATFLRDQHLFTREYSRRYHASVAAAIRVHDPNHLVLGSRWRGFPGEAVMLEAGYPHSDCLSISSSEPALWTQLLRRCGRDDPVMLDRVQWRLIQDAHETVLPGSASALERRLREGCAALQDVAAQPALVGYEWAAWADDPFEAPLFGSGLIRGSGLPAREHADLLGAINSRMEFWRSGGASLS